MGAAQSTAGLAEQLPGEAADAQVRLRMGISEHTGSLKISEIAKRRPKNHAE
jgi:hypothetical protein